ncbi:MAG TPA: Rrf2 family transcriptional regulator [Bacillota bacterium]|jgi:Rrf2 family protein|nr:Rrf2 family transcriptional regulator [Bacillota bacterium]HQE66464.1 Rrf2 family transcriptional regulator [Bacillota bacterium]HQI16138.1 Rrf2 family transcriptional regulator [Bacillota bacterium]HQJ37069.1 Rrf2 family transcriptional regulator [Bacillota bacterium]HQL36007.1 Rrf2 family transcriptional regulator [Bacillota bacterium]
MILSTKGRYGLKIMYELALNYGEGPMSLKEVAQRQQLSETYLEQLIAHLKKAGLVKSIRGAQGGYELIRKPEEISVGEIIRTLEGPLAPSECVMVDEPECTKAENCVTRLIWEKIMEGINNVVDSITLNDMVNDYYKLKQKKEGEK